MSPRLGVWVIVATSAAGLLAQAAWSQGRGGTSSGGTSTGSTGSTGAGTTGGTVGRGTGTTTNLPGNSTTPGTTTNNGGTPRRSVLFITGHFVLEEGGAPPDTVVVERVCNGSARAEGYSDSKGYFSVEIGDETGVFQDASETANYSLNGGSGSGTGSRGGISSSTGGSASGSMSDMRYANCDLRGKLAGYRSQTVSLANRRPLDDPNIGVILLHREGRDEGSTVSAVSLSAPKDAHRAFEHGLQLLKKGKTDDAEKEFHKAVTLYPKYADAWNEIGRIQLDRDQKFDARQSFQTAIQADPKFVNPYLQLSLLDMEEKKWQDLADVTDQALKLDPFDYPRAWLFNGAAYWNLKKLDKAEKSIRQAERLDGQHTLPDVSRLMAMILLHRHEYAEAIGYMQAFLKLAPESVEAEKVRAQLAEAEKMKADTTASAKQDQ